MITARLFRTSERDALVLGAALAHVALLAAGLALAAAPGTGTLARAALVVVLGLAMNWGSNTVSHIHLHAPLFRAEPANRAFALALSVLLAVPQAWWKLRHLQHHGLPEGSDPQARRRLLAQGAVELAALLAFLIPFVARAPLAFVTVYAPAMLLGFALCAWQGHAEHARSADGVDVHRPLYNRLWFNDGFHAAHHRAPTAHWTTLPSRAAPGDVVSALPPILRWVEGLPARANRAAAAVIDLLERATLGLPLVRRFLLATHTRAFHALLARADLAGIREVTIIGGGLFPRTALVLARLLPHARLTIVDAVPGHLATARAFIEGDTAPVGDAASRVRFVEGVLDADARGPGGAAAAADLVVVPLAFRGDRARFYQSPPARLVAVHDWVWRRRGAASHRVSFLLMKRLNLVTHENDHAPRRSDLLRPGRPPLLRPARLADHG